MGYRCIHCRVLKEDGSKVYFIKSLKSSLMEPVCSKACANKEINSNIKILENKIDEFKNIKLKEEVW